MGLWSKLKWGGTERYTGKEDGSRRKKCSGSIVEIEQEVCLEYEIKKDNSKIQERVRLN